MSFDERTIEANERVVLAEVRRHGGFSVWWATEGRKRPIAIENLVQRGAIRRVGGVFPFAEYEIAPNAELRGAAK